MTKKFPSSILTILLALLALTPLAGCYYGPYEGPGVGVEVGGPPPGLRAEVRVGPPGPGYYWVPGYWDWNVSRADWFWVSGSWVRPPRARAVWVSPRYERHRNHWMYRRGHWR
jgi:hypothetical protein